MEEMEVRGKLRTWRSHFVHSESGSSIRSDAWFPRNGEARQPPLLPS